MFLADVSDIFHFFSSGREKGEAEARGRIRFSIENPKGGGVLQDGKGRGAGRVCGELGIFWGRGWAKCFFGGRNVHQCFIDAQCGKHPDNHSALQVDVATR